ncbi:MAG: hypothetical protein HC834_04670 [Rhodospirillales bacterium]|nr:hypothetical protein [Rhodospirillales bacterium]
MMPRLQTQRLSIPALTRARMTQLAGRAEVMVVLDQGLVSAGNFALTALIARLLPLADFGVYMLIMTMVWVFTDLQVATITGPYTINRQKLSVRKQTVYFGSTAVHQGALILVAMLVTGFSIGFQDIGGTSQSAAILGGGTASLAVAGLLARDQIRRLLIIHQKPAECLKLDALVLVLHGLGVVAGVVTGHFSLVWAFASAAVACILPCLLWLPRLGALHDRWRLTLRHWRLNWGVGRWMVLSGMMWSLAVYLYPWTLAATHGTAATGLWAAALGLSSLCNVPLSGLQNHYAVRIAAADRQEVGRAVTTTALRLAALAAVFVFVFLIGGERLMGLLYGQSFAVAAPLTVLMTVNLMVGAVSFCVSRGLFAIGRGGTDCAVNVIPLLAFALGGAWITLWFGPMGAVVSFLVSNALALMVRIFVLSRELPGQSSRLGSP